MDPAIAKLLSRHHLEPAHSAECLAEAEAHLAQPGFDDAALVDLEHLPFVTIDNDDSRDLDQAIYVAAGDAGGHEVWYALADAAYYVRPGSALFAEALQRGASYYLPSMVVPMLPRSLSEGLISLNEGVVRRALTFRVALDERGEVDAVEILRARMRSRKKLSYRGVQALWDGDRALADQEFSDSLWALREVGRKRRELAEAANVVQYQRVEVEVEVSSDQRFVAIESRRHETDRANEQISLLVNTEGARLLARARPELQAVFRVHPAPLSEDLDALVRMSAAVAAHRGEPRLTWARGEEPLARWLDRLAGLPAGMRSSVLALQRQALLVNQRSSFAREPGRHYGVGAPCYARFSSPMREVVGIFTHKEALEMLAQMLDGRDDEALRAAVIRSANRAKERQRQLTKAANQLVIADLLGADLERPADARVRRRGTVVGLKHDKVYVVLDDPPLELKVYARDLGREAHLEGDGTRLVVREPDATVTLGDEVSLLVTGHDRGRDRYQLAFIPI